MSFSALSALLTIGQFAIDAHAIGLCLLGLAFAKAWIILSDYLGLRVAPAWHKGFSGVIAAYLIVLAVLFLAG
jgi:hypothetical protein